MAYGNQGQAGFFNPATIIANQVIIVGPGESLLAYSPSQGPDNLVASVAAASFTDTFGNQVFAGVFNYVNVGGSNFTAVGIDAGELQFWTSSTGEAGPWTEGAKINYSGTTWLFEMFSGAFIEFIGNIVASGAVNVGGVLTAADGMNLSGGNLNVTNENLNVNGGNINLNGGTGAVPPFNNLIEDIWHIINNAGQPTLNAGFAVGAPGPRFQFEPINGGRVRLDGIVLLTAANPAGTTIFTLPTGYVPAIFHQFSGQVNSLSGYTLGGKSIQVNNAGQVQLGSNGINGNSVTLDGIVIPLD